ncbi:DUF4827 domain-containing protein [Streptomyces sp. OfavH-34-F]|uniref:DUF4827 domain-containing protein n=1 Tax=Streptomyces sp. OfavH-34-F TaxID=2917760 RepID=UPI001EF31CB8|nr:DUF4827 domain-containing protein [Streptomyces sp. OfavH-34-F]MCG7526940.1 DUF4827 domain-containing protein [Streptomyces sp. OfavH-34-F]
MGEDKPQGQPAGWLTGLTYVGALLSGAALIMTGHASPAEASGYVAPFLVVYEKLAQRNSRI